MKTLGKRFASWNPWSQTIAVTGLRLTAWLLFCSLLLLRFAPPPTCGTYFQYQLAGAMQDVARSVLLLSAVGIVWMQHLHKKSDNR